MREAWTAQWPDVELNLTVDLSKYHDNRIDRAHLQGLHVADIAVLQTLQDFRRWKAEGKLVNYKPASFEDLLESEKDFDGAYLPTNLSQSIHTRHRPRATYQPLTLLNDRWLWHLRL